MNKSVKARFYGKSDAAGVVKPKKELNSGFSTKRITMNISERIYNEANDLDEYFHMGYQNVLKTAIAVGLTELYHQVSSHKTNGK